MAKSIPVASKRRGRPPTGGRDPGIHIRLPEEMLSTVDAWATSKEVTRSEAIRRLVELGLKTKK
jgi:Ribbon-helix-helix protein, copG family